MVKCNQLTSLLFKGLTVLNFQTTSYCSVSLVLALAAVQTKGVILAGLYRPTLSWSSSWSLASFLFQSWAKQVFLLQLCM